MTIVAFSTTAIALEIQDSQFLLDGEPTFLLGASYYGALGASDDFVDRDLNDLKRLGFNWIRVFAALSVFENNVSALDAKGNAREPYLSRLKNLCGKANQLGMIVDVTLSSSGRIAKFRISSHEAHLNAVTVLTKELMEFRNIYFDVGNERNTRGAMHVSFDDAGALRNRIKELDPERLVTASHAGDISEEELRSYVQTAQVDFITPHLPRNAKSPGQKVEITQKYLKQLEKLGKVMPVHYQEPLRRDFGKWQPKAQDFLTDLKNSIGGKAAGWCFHNGDAMDQDDGRPRRSFDMRDSEGRLFDQLDADEKAVVEQVASILSGS
jgi:hypothetical protein